MDAEAWLTQNRAALRQRLQWLQAQPQGIIFTQPSTLQVVAVEKAMSQIRLWLLEPGSTLVQSRLELDDPLHLVSPYSQAALLSLAWTDNPHRIYLIGLGGGRIPLALHHYYPQTVIESTEIDEIVIEVAHNFFGVQPDERLLVAHQDGRAYLAEREAQLRYDIIFVDAFAGNGPGPFRMATRDFYQLCQAHLAPGGVVVINLLPNDPLRLEKLKTLSSAFEQVYLWLAPGQNTVAFGTTGPLLSQAELIERAQALQERHQFSFSLVARAAEVATDLAKSLPDLEQIAILLDTPSQQSDPGMSF